MGRWRLILDLSYPLGRSVNDGISRELSSLHYVSVDTATRVLELGAGALLAKVDIAQAYRNVPVHQDDRLMLGMNWKGRLFVDKVLPFGLRSAPKVFTAIADEMGTSRTKCEVVHSLHCHYTARLPNSHKCQEFFSLIKAVCAHLGFPLKWEKVEGPACTIEILGIVMDTQQLTVADTIEQWSQK